MSVARALGLAAAATALAGAVGATTVGASRPAAVRPPQTPHAMRFVDEQVMARAQERARPVRAMPGVRAVIVPHHWLAGDLIVEGIRDAATSGRFRRVIIVGPNHHGAGASLVATSVRPWATPWGIVEPDRGALASLPADLVRAEPAVLDGEHAIGGIVPVVARYIPGATVVPLALRAGLGWRDVRRLADAVVPLMDAATLLVASVDFSHYLDVDQARRNDAETRAALRAFASDRIMRFGNEHLDSPQSIAMTLEVARALGARRFDLRRASDSSWYGGSPRNVTTYVLGWFG